MIEQCRESLHDRKSEADAASAVPLRIADLVELLEHARLLAFLDAAAGVPYLHAQSRADATADQDLAAVRVSNRVGDDVAQDPLEQDRIAVHERACRPHAQPQSLSRRLTLIVLADALHERLYRKRSAPDLDDTGIEARDIEQAAEQSAQRADRGLDMVEQPTRFAIHLMRAQRGDEQTHGMHRLPQVVARGGEEARLGNVGFFGERFLTTQILHQLLVLMSQPDRLGELPVRSSCLFGHRHEPQHEQHADGDVP